MSQRAVKYVKVHGVLNPSSMWHDRFRTFQHLFLRYASYGSKVVFLLCQLFFLSIVYSKMLYSVFSMWRLFLFAYIDSSIFKIFSWFWFGFLFCFVLNLWLTYGPFLLLPWLFHFFPPLPFSILSPLCPYGCIKISIKQLSSPSLILPALYSQFTPLHRIFIFP